MTREESEKYIKSKMCSDCGVHLGGGKCLDNCNVIEAIKALEQEPSKDMEEIEEVINCDADAEIKLKMISNIVHSKPHYFKTSRENKIIDEHYWKGFSNGIRTAEWRATKQESTVTSTNNNGEMVYPQVEGITPTVVNEDIYECSCGYGWDKNKTSRFHFCPNCGKAVGDGNDYKYIKSISNPTGIEFDIDIPKKIESYEKLLKHPVIKHIMDMDETQEQLDFVQLHKRVPVTLTVESDCISRQEAIDTIRQLYIDLAIQKYVIDILKALPSVKPQESCDVPDTNVGDIISKQTVLDTISELNAISFYEAQEDSKETYYEIRQTIKDLPSVKPQERTGHWIPVKFRPLTDEEQKEYPDYCYMADCPMPDDGEEILVSTKYGRVEKDECGFDDGYYLDSGYDWQTDIVAWMPLPELYKPQESEET